MYRHDNEPNDSETSRVSHLSRIPVIAEGKQRTFRTITDENGLYNFRKLPAGEYKVRAVLPDKYIHYWSLDERVDVASKGYGTFVEFSAGWNNSVKGRITDEAGNVVRRAVVRLLPVDSTDDRMSPNLEDVVDYLGDKGEYRITGKTPGRYILAVEVSAPFPSGPQVLRTYYSQAAGRQNASIITLGETNNLELDVKLTSDQRVRWIDGVMLWSDGTPVSRNGWVFLEKLENSDDMNNFRYDLTPVDPQGGFGYRYLRMPSTG